jgi:dynein heavy chain
MCIYTYTGDRVKTITIITLDVHGRDVVQRLIDEKVEGLEAFLWQQQLRFYWMNQNNAMDTEIRICDFKTKYFYEWIGDNTLCMFNMKNLVRIGYYV